MADEIDDVVIPYLSSQFSRARPVLFTGAGFSAAAYNITGETVPTGQNLIGRLWDLCYPDQPLEPAQSLQLLYEDAHRHHPRQLTELLVKLLTVDAETLPPWYSAIFDLPWFRAYTLNVDDLEIAVSRKFKLARRPIQVSATGPVPQRAAHGDFSRDLEVVHLNGTKEDLPDRVTFSVTQYAQRLATPDPWYARLVADIASRPFVFVGTVLDESPLWQHIELRELRGARSMKELRPRSYLVAPTLDRTRRSLLTEFNVTWLPMTSEEFGTRIAQELRAASSAGFALIDRESNTPGFSSRAIPEVAELATDPTRKTEFLLGEEPIWADVQSGRAISRAIDVDISGSVEARLKSDRPGVVAISGTAGSGKSASLMRLALALSASGLKTGWLDRDTELTSRDIREFMRSSEAPKCLAIDDGDLFGNELSSLLRELAMSDSRPLLAVALRATKVDRTLNQAVLAEVPMQEIAMPLLVDGDIDSLVDSLTRDNRLGRLKGLSRNQQRAAFREQAGRQLLVAMIQATSGELFEDKAIREFNELDAPARLIYALVATSSALRYSLGRDEILIATGDRSNTALNMLDALYPFHVLGKQGLWWSRRAGEPMEDRARNLANLISVVSDGIRLHPNAGELELIHDELKREYMGLALAEYEASTAQGATPQKNGDA